MSGLDQLIERVRSFGAAHHTKKATLLGVAFSMCILVIPRLNTGATGKNAIVAPCNHHNKARLSIALSGKIRQAF